MAEIGRLWLWWSLVREIRPWPVPFLRTRFYLADRKFLPCQAEEVKQALQNFSITFSPNAEENDCDDATFRMLGYLKGTIRGALGFAWSPKHSFVIFHDGVDLWVVEPFDKNYIVTYAEAKTDPFKRYNLAWQGLVVI